jgi:hypothetical protein
LRVFSRQTLLKISIVALLQSSILSLFAAKIHRNSARLLIPLQLYCEERGARRGNLYQTRNAPFYIEIGNNGRLSLSPAQGRVVFMSNAVCTLPEILSHQPPLQVVV